MTEAIGREPEPPTPPTQGEPEPGAEATVAPPLPPDILRRVRDVPPLIDYDGTELSDPDTSHHHSADPLDPHFPSRETGDPLDPDGHVR